MFCECTDCGHEFTPEIPINFSCPKCGGRRLKGRDHIKISLTPIEVIGYRMRDGTRRGKKNRDSVKYTKRLSFFRETKEWHYVERTLDRKLDLYHEFITCRETGRVVRDICEPLSKHQGHGSAKVKPAANNADAEPTDIPPNTKLDDQKD
ncbi:hypothetical protein GCM10009552_29170 [Rothia nasimurium]